MTAEKWTIYWNEYTAGTYLYGTRLQIFGKNDILFENSLMPPGTIIKTWYSKTNFQQHHVEPTLPIIDGESQYEIVPSLEYPKGGSCLLRLVFLDRYGEDAGFMMVHGEPTRFRCPLKTYSYRLELMNAGAEAIRFHHITIREVTDEHE